MCHKIGENVSGGNGQRPFLEKRPRPAERLVIGCLKAPSKRAPAEAGFSNRALQSPPGGAPLGAPPQSGIDDQSPPNRRERGFSRTRAHAGPRGCQDSRGTSRKHLLETSRNLEKPRGTLKEPLGNLEKPRETSRTAKTRETSRNLEKPRGLADIG